MVLPTNVSRAMAPDGGPLVKKLSTSGFLCRSLAGQKHTVQHGHGHTGN